MISSYRSPSLEIFIVCWFYTDMCVSSQAGHFPPTALNQMIGGLVGQLLSGATGQMGTVAENLNL